MWFINILKFSYLYYLSGGQYHFLSPSITQIHVLFSVHDTYCEHYGILHKELETPYKTVRWIYLLTETKIVKHTVHILWKATPPYCLSSDTFPHVNLTNLKQSVRDALSWKYSSWKITTQSHFNHIVFVKRALFHPFQVFIVMKSELIFSISLYSYSKCLLKRHLWLSMLSFYSICMAKRNQIVWRLWLSSCSKFPWISWLVY